MKNVVFEEKRDPFSYLQAKSLSPLPHFHKHLELIYVINGRAEAFADRKKTIIKNGDLFISFPNQTHFYDNSVIGEYLVVLFSPDIIFGLHDILMENIPKSNTVSLNNASDTESLLTKLIETEGEFAKTIMAGLLNQIMAQILPNMELKARIKTNNTTLQEVLDYCATNFADDVTLDDIAETLHISRFHISHLINQKLGMNLNTYLNSLRINTACDMLADTDKRISDISEEVGFGSIRSFNRAFIGTVNMTPNQYRSQFRQS